MIGAEQMKAGKTVTEFPIDFDKVGQIIMIAIGMYVISAIFNFLQQFIMTRVSQRTVYELRRDLEEKMNRLPISYYDTHSNGDIMSRAINDMDNIASTLQQNLTQFITSIVNGAAKLDRRNDRRTKITKILCCATKELGITE